MRTATLATLNTACPRCGLTLLLRAPLVLVSEQALGVDTDHLQLAVTLHLRSCSGPHRCRR